MREFQSASQVFLRELKPSGGSLHLLDETEMTGKKTKSYEQRG